MRQAAVDAFPAASPFGEREKEREKPKRGNIQERWQQAVQTQVQSSPSPSSPVEVPAWKKRMTGGSVTFPSPGVGEKTPTGSGGRGSLGAQMPVAASVPAAASPTDVFGRRTSPVPAKAALVSTPEPTTVKAAPAALGDTKSGIQPKPLSHVSRFIPPLIA